ncbi:MAG: hypothetical protein V3U76_13630 [Granulosicoccus sp.]
MTIGIVVRRSCGHDDGKRLCTTSRLVRVRGKLSSKVNLAAKYLFIYSAVLMLSSCTTEQLPIGAHLIVSPSEHTIKIIENRDANDRCMLNPDYYVDFPVVITLLDVNESPIGDHDVSVYLDFAANTFSGYGLLALYKDANGNGVVDGDEELVSGREDNIAVVSTHSLYGSETLLLRVNLSCSFKGSITAIANGVVGKASILVVTEGVIDEPDPEVET